MSPSRHLCLVSCLLLGLLAGQAFCKPVPVFVWSKGQQLASSLDKRSARVSYESLPSAAVATELATGQASKLLNNEVAIPDLVVVFFGSKLNVADLSRSSDVEPLRAVLEAAGSSVSLPHVEFKEGISLAAQVVPALDGLPTRLHAFDGCQPEEAINVVRSLGKRAPRAGSGRDLVLVSSCHTAGLYQQTTLAAAMNEVLEGTERPHVLAFAGDAQALQSSTGRSLLDFNLPAGVSAEQLAALQASGLTAEQLQALAGSTTVSKEDLPANVDLSNLPADDAAAVAAAAAAGAAGGSSEAGESRVPAAPRGGATTFVQANLQAIPSPGPQPPIPPGVDPRTLPFNICPVGSQCQTQVRQFEIVILFITLIIALGVGTGMMHILDTPSRFELPKDSNARSDNS